MLRWPALAIVLRGRHEFVVRSAHQNPKAFTKLETALVEIQGMGLRHTEVDFMKWDREQSTILERNAA
jgi:hypothetical protein